MLWSLQPGLLPHGVEDVGNMTGRQGGVWAVLRALALFSASQGHSLIMKYMAPAVPALGLPFTGDPLIHDSLKRGIWQPPAPLVSDSQNVEFYWL